MFVTHHIAPQLGHPSRTEQCRRLWHWFLHGPEARGGALPLHLDHPRVELREPATACLQDSIEADLCPRSSDHRRLPQRGQLPPFLPWQLDVDAQWRARWLEADQEKAWRTAGRQVVYGCGRGDGQRVGVRPVPGHVGAYGPPPELPARERIRADRPQEGHAQDNCPDQRDDRQHPRKRHPRRECRHQESLELCRHRWPQRHLHALRRQLVRRGGQLVLLVRDLVGNEGPDTRQPGLSDGAKRQRGRRGARGQRAPEFRKRCVDPEWDSDTDKR